uniref:Uncharacterized protein LOC102807118 n=1 Tax=Saccoglossus kowalevskii TaxID=10224 RepID=A0ABM0MSZ6_SACKO|nr:PREDICTED: uncharacterized protein LOC102807118 [Saccoglossus kowalevskii]
MRVTLAQGDTQICVNCKWKRFGNGNADDRGEDPTKGLTASGVMINELDCFLINKIDILPTDILAKLCVDHFEDDDIDFAKRTLFDLCCNDITSRFIKRQGHNKRSNNVLDMIKLIHEIDEENLPCFVAKNLTKLPPFDITHVDVSFMAKKLKSLRREVLELKSETNKDLMQDLSFIRKKLNQLKSRLSSPRVDDVELNLPSAIEREIEPNANELIIRETDYNLGRPIPRHAIGKTPTQMSEQTESVSYAEIAKTLRHDVTKNVPLKWNRETESTVGVTKNATPVVSTKVISKSTSNYNNEFTIVQRRQQPTVGTAKVNDARTIKVAHSSPPFKLFVTRLAPSTTEQDICSYVNQVFDIKVKCEKLETKFDTYASFQVKTTISLARCLLSPTSWPNGILIPKFY